MCDSRARLASVEGMTVRNVGKSRLELSLCAIALIAACTTVLDMGECPPPPDSGQTVEKLTCRYWPDDDTDASSVDAEPAFDAGASTADAATQ